MGGCISRSPLFLSPLDLIQLKAMVKKAFIIMSRTKRELFREIGMPIVVMGVLVLLSNIKASVGSPQTIHHLPRPIPPLATAASGKQIWMAPCDYNLPNSFVAKVASRLSTAAGQNVTCFSCESVQECGNSLLGAYPAVGSALLAAVVFDSITPNPADPSSPVRYRIRMDRDLYVPGTLNTNTTSMYQADGSYAAPDSTPAAYISYFVPVQVTTDAAITAVLAEGAPLPTISFVATMFPTPAYSINVIASVLQGIVPIYTSLIFVLQVRSLVTRVLVEKERKIRITLKMMGLSDEVYRLHWLITATLKMLILVTVVSVICSLGKIFAHSSLGVIWVFYALFGLTCIAFSFCASALFSKSSTGGAAAMLLYLATAAPSYALTTNAVPLSGKLILSLLAPCGFGLGQSVILLMEADATGASWNNLWDVTSSSAGVPLGSLMLMLALDAILYWLLAWYLEKVVPSEFGVTRHPLFCFGFRRSSVSRTNLSCSHVSLCSGQTTTPADSIAKPVHKSDAVQKSGAVQKSDAVHKSDEVTQLSVASSVPTGDVRYSNSQGASRLLAAGAVVEELTEGVKGRPGVFVNSLTKVFTSAGPSTTAIDHLTLDFFEGHVTCLLGHNGSGKTTLVSMLTGLFAPTSGDAHVYGLSILNDSAAICRMTGVCPQDNVFFDELTVNEHLELLGSIKGLRDSELQAQVSQIAKEVGLQQNLAALALTLSGGMKRKLCMGMALMGLPKVLILDEPTSGLDPGARHLLWSAIQKYKAGRVVILTTHYMDEADLLGDRIALLARGKLRVCGSSTFLKNRFGLGYTLSATVTGNRPPELNLATKLLELCRETVSVASLEDSRETHVEGCPKAMECSVLVPIDQVSRLPSLLNCLESKRPDRVSTGEFAVVGYEIAITSLDDVFIRLESLVEAAEFESMHASNDTRVDVPQPHAQGGAANDMHDVLPTQTLPASQELDWGWLAAVNKARTEGVARQSWSFLCMQVRAISRRRMLQFRRSPQVILLWWLAPLIFVGIGLIFLGMKNTVSTSSYTAEQMVPSSFTSAQVNATDYFSAVIAQFSPSNALSDYLSTVLPYVPAIPATPGAPRAVYVSGGGPRNQTDMDVTLLSASNVAAAIGFDSALSNSTYTAYLSYNYTLTNVIPTIVSWWDSAVLLAALNSSVVSVAGASGTNQSIFTSFDPLPPLSAATKTNLIITYLTAGLLGFYMSIGYLTIPATAAGNIIEERQNKSKQMQLLMGTTRLAYWIGMWITDAILYIVPWIGALVIIFSASSNSFVNASQYGAVVLLLLLYGLSISSMTYMMTFMFSKHSDGQTWIRMGLTAVTLVLFVATFGLNFPILSLSSGLVAFSTALEYIGMQLPPYALAKGYTDVIMQGICSTTGLYAQQSCSSSALAWDVAGAKVFFMALAIPLWSGLVLYIEYRNVPAVSQQSAPPATSPQSFHEDEDVLAERATVARLRLQGAFPGLLAENLRKRYLSAANVPKEAVVGLSFHVPKDEVFGLLGPNGAGKSTAISMLVGELGPTAGQAYIDGLTIHEIQQRSLDYVGYCPQGNALFDLLTGAETLEYFARINGCPSSKIPSVVLAALKSLDLTSNADKLVKAYSGGNKRRLSLAIAYISAPRIVFLDECSTGVDPFARKRIFQVINHARSGRATIMTTHSMEEADALCSRIGIMVSGRLACVGTSPHLKQKYGKGYLINIVLPTTQPAAPAAVVIPPQAASNPQRARGDVADPMIDKLKLGEIAQGLQLVEHNGIQLRYAMTSINLPDAFSRLEGLKQNGLLRDYSVTQTSLESVFLNFSRAQEAYDDQFRLYEESIIANRSRARC